MRFSWLRCNVQITLLAALWFSAWHKSMAIEDCPDGSYRTSPIVFSCGGGFGHTSISVVANQSMPLAIPVGVEGFRISANSSAGHVRLQLHDAVTNALVVSQDHGLINSTVRAGVYKDVGIVYSGNLSRANVSLYLLGALTAPLKLSFATTARSGTAKVHLAYTFERVLECSRPPAGCREYHEEDARWQVQVWSRWARSEFQNASQAWQILAEEHSEEHGVHGVAWSEWPKVWSVFVGNSSIQVAGEEWQPSFRYLDTDRDGFVSREEFELGFSGGKVKSREVPVVEEVLSETQGAVRSHLWLVCALASCVLLLLAWSFFRCRSSRPKRVARSVSKLSRDDALTGQVLKTGKPGLAAQAHNREPLTKGVNGGSDMTQTPVPSAQAARVKDKAPGEGLWLFPSIGQALPSFVTRESFRYQPLATQEEMPAHHASPGPGPGLAGPSLQVGFPPSPDSFAGWHAPHAPQPSSFSLMPPAAASGLQLQMYSPELGPSAMGSLPPREDPRMQAMLHAAWASRLTQGSAWSSANAPHPPASASSFADAGVVQAELAGPVQVETPAPGTGLAAGTSKAAAEYWAEVAAAVSPPRPQPLSAEIRDMK